MNVKRSMKMSKDRTQIGYWQEEVANEKPRNSFHHSLVMDGMIS
jgi:hypothetical protein